VSAPSPNGAQQLVSRQSLAVDLLPLGRTDAEVAGELGADRSTLWRWRQQPDFQAELARRREELWAGSFERAYALISQGLDVVADALDEGDSRAALAFLRLMRVGDVAVEGVAKAGAATQAGPDWVELAEAFDAEVRRLAVDRRGEET
jgi:putative insertion element HTH domain-containing protein